MIAPAASSCTGRVIRFARYQPVHVALRELAVRFCVNPRPEDGQGTSIAVGVAALDPRATAVVVVLGDQPGLGPEVLPRLVETFRRTAAAVVAPVYRGVQGNPVLFGVSVFGELRALSGDTGARSVVRRDPARVVLVPFDLDMPAGSVTLYTLPRSIPTGLSYPSR